MFYSKVSPSATRRMLTDVKCSIQYSGIPLVKKATTDLNLEAGCRIGGGRVLLDPWLAMDPPLSMESLKARLEGFEARAGMDSENLKAGMESLKAQVAELTREAKEMMGEITSLYSWAR